MHDQNHTSPMSSTMVDMPKEHHSAMPMNHMGHMSHMGNLKQKFWISLVLALPVLFLTPMMGITLPFQFAFPGSDWVVLAASTILFFYGGMPFLQGAKSELENGKPAMMTLITLGITTAYVYSLYAFVINHFFAAHGHLMNFFWELATLIVIMLLGHWLEMKAVSGAGDALQKMAALLPTKVNLRQKDGSFAEIPLPELKNGQIAMVKAGEKIPADGIIIEGRSDVNESLVTGEARVVVKESGDKVIGGSQNGNGTIIIKVTGTGETGYLAQVMKIVGSALADKSKAETISDKVARFLFYAAFFGGIISFVVWYRLTGDLGMSITRMVTVFIIACPHALGLAIPLVAARSTSLGAMHGLLVRNRQAMEVATKINIVMMDKTGTLTEGNFKVITVKSLVAELTENEVLTKMAALETGSSHPLAVGILKETETRGLKPDKMSDLQNLAGVGISGKLSNGTEVKIVNSAYLTKNKQRYDENISKNFADKGYSVSFLLIGNKVVGLVAQGDEIKPQSKELIVGLKERKITPVMLTGDNLAAAKTVAAQLHITDYKAEQLPGNKAEIVREYEHKGFVTMMVGDGINDAPALAAADVGVAIGAGTDIAIDSADVVLVRSNPLDILQFLSLSKKTTSKMVQNLWWGAGYNIIAIPLAAGVLAPVGILLSPAVGAVLMSVSTVIVAANAMWLRID